MCVSVGRKNCTDLDLMKQLISREEAGCTHPVNLVMSRNWPVWFTAPEVCFFLSVLPYPLFISRLFQELHHCDADPLSMAEIISVATSWEQAQWYKGPFCIIASEP